MIIPNCGLWWSSRDFKNDAVRSIAFLAHALNSQIDRIAHCHIKVLQTQFTTLIIQNVGIRFESQLYLKHCLHYWFESRHSFSTFYCISHYNQGKKRFAHSHIRWSLLTCSIFKVSRAITAQNKKRSHIIFVHMCWLKLGCDEWPYDLSG